MLHEFNMAAKIAKPTGNRHLDPRNFWLGCVGKRKDGIIVSSKNGAVMSSDWKKKHLIPEAHAEVRALKKSGRGATLYVARLSKIENNFVMARPCSICRNFAKSYRIEKIYYTINNFQYGIYDPRLDTDKVINCITAGKHI
jgi:tRNA(Arg) A34 adenosine deaminase TadA